MKRWRGRPLLSGHAQHVHINIATEQQHAMVIDDGNDGRLGNESNYYEDMECNGKEYDEEDQSSMKLK